MKLSPRQKEIVNAIAAGSTTKEIAASLGISPFTVESHRRTIVRRLKCRNMFQALVKIFG